VRLVRHQAPPSSSQDQFNDRLDVLLRGEQPLPDLPVRDVHDQVADRAEQPPANIAARSPRGLHDQHRDHDQGEQRGGA
jgi:hypothetical protein